MGAMAHSALGAPPLIRTACELVILTALLLILGLATFAAAIISKSAQHPVSAQFRAPLLLLSIAALAAVPLQLLSASAAMAGTGMEQCFALTPEVLCQTSFGLAWIVSLPLLMILTAAAWSISGSRRPVLLIAAIAATLLAVHAAISHAIDFGAVAVISYFIHETAAALWSGALLGLVLVWRGGVLDDASGRLIVVRTSGLAGWSVAALIASGLYLAYCALGLNLDHLLYSAYGRTLIVKVTIFGIAALVGGYNRYWLVPCAGVPSARSELMRTVKVELLLILGVFALAVLLANTPPSH